MIVFQIIGNDGLHLQLNLLGKMIQFGGPSVSATDALHHDDGETSYDDHAAIVMTLRTDDRERVAGIWHGWGIAIVVQSLSWSNAGLCNRTQLLRSSRLFIEEFARSLSAEARDAMHSRSLRGAHRDRGRGTAASASRRHRTTGATPIRFPLQRPRTSRVVRSVRPCETVLRGGCSSAASADADQGSERLGPRQTRKFWAR